MKERPKIGVGVLVIDEGKILLGERIGAHGEGTWSPPGGHLEFGETPLVCAARELEEETALCAEEMVEGPWTNDVFAKEGKHYVSLYVIVTKFSGTPIVTEPDKCRVWRWFSWDELPEPLFLSLKNLVEAEGLEKIMRSQVNESAMRG